MPEGGYQGLVVGCKVRVLSDPVVVKDLCNKLGTWSRSKEKRCGCEAEISEIDPVDSSCRLKFDDGRFAWFADAAITAVGVREADLSEHIQTDYFDSSAVVSKQVAASITTNESHFTHDESTVKRRVLDGAPPPSDDFIVSRNSNNITTGSDFSDSFWEQSDDKYKSAIESKQPQPDDDIFSDPQPFVSTINGDKDTTQPPETNDPFTGQVSTRESETDSFIQQHPTASDPDDLFSSQRRPSLAQEVFASQEGDPFTSTTPQNTLNPITSQQDIIPQELEGHEVDPFNVHPNTEQLNPSDNQRNVVESKRSEDTVADPFTVQQGDLNQPPQSILSNELTSGQGDVDPFASQEPEETSNLAADPFAGQLNDIENKLASEQVDPFASQPEETSDLTADPFADQQNDPPQSTLSNELTSGQGDVDPFASQQPGETSNLAADPFAGQQNETSQSNTENKLASGQSDIDPFASQPEETSDLTADPFAGQQNETSQSNTENKLASGQSDIDPFASQPEETSDLTADPFAGQQNETSQSNTENKLASGQSDIDPFASQPEETSDLTADPFAGQESDESQPPHSGSTDNQLTSGNAEVDPFAGQQDDEDQPPQPDAENEIVSGQSAMDSFSLQQPQDDPFAGQQNDESQLTQSIPNNELAPGHGDADPFASQQSGDCLNLNTDPLGDQQQPLLVENKLSSGNAEVDPFAEQQSNDIQPSQSQIDNELTLEKAEADPFAGQQEDGNQPLQSGTDGEVVSEQIDPFAPQPLQSNDSKEEEQTNPFPSQEVSNSDLRNPTEEWEVKQQQEQELIASSDDVVDPFSGEIIKSKPSTGTPLDHQESAVDALHTMELSSKMSELGPLPPITPSAGPHSAEFGNSSSQIQRVESQKDVLTGLHLSQSESHLDRSQSEPMSAGNEQPEDDDVELDAFGAPLPKPKRAPSPTPPTVSAPTPPTVSAPTPPLAPTPPTAPVPAPEVTEEVTETDVIEDVSKTEEHSNHSDQEQEIPNQEPDHPKQDEPEDITGVEEPQDTTGVEEGTDSFKSFGSFSDCDEDLLENSKYDPPTDRSLPEAVASDEIKQTDSAPPQQVSDNDTQKEVVTEQPKQESSKPDEQITDDSPDDVNPAPGDVNPTPGDVNPAPGDVSPPGEVESAPGEVDPFLAPKIELEPEVSNELTDDRKPDYEVDDILLKQPSVDDPFRTFSQGSCEVLPQSPMASQLPSTNWVELVVPDSGQLYYYNQLTNESVWDKPLEYQTYESLLQQYQQQQQQQQPQQQQQQEEQYSRVEEQPVDPVNSKPKTDIEQSVSPTEVSHQYSPGGGDYAAMPVKRGCPISFTAGKLIIANLNKKSENGSSVSIIPFDDVFGYHGVDNGPAEYSVLTDRPANLTNSSKEVVSAYISGFPAFGPLQSILNYYASNSYSWDQQHWGPYITALLNEIVVGDLQSPMVDHPIPTGLEDDQQLSTEERLQRALKREQNRRVEDHKREETLRTVQRLLLLATPQEAIPFAVANKEFSTAMAIAACTDQDAWKSVQLEHAKSLCSQSPLFHALLVGQEINPIDHMDSIDVSKDTGWKSILLAILKLPMGQFTTQVISSLMEKLLHLGEIDASHFCALCIIARWGVRSLQLLPILLGGTHQGPVCRSAFVRPQSVIQTELLEGFMQQNGSITQQLKKPFQMNHLHPYRLAFAMWLFEHGQYETCMSTITAVEQHKNLLSPGALHLLDDLKESAKLHLEGAKSSGWGISRLWGGGATKPTKGVMKKKDGSLSSPTPNAESLSEEMQKSKRKSGWGFSFWSRKEDDETPQAILPDDKNKKFGFDEKTGQWFFADSGEQQQTPSIGASAPPRIPPKTPPQQAVAPPGQSVGNYPTYLNEIK